MGIAVQLEISCIDSAIEYVTLGHPDIARRCGANRDDGINADLLCELLAPQEEERRASGSAEIGMWLDNLDKFQSMKRKMVPGEAGARRGAG